MISNRTAITQLRQQAANRYAAALTRPEVVTAVTDVNPGDILDGEGIVQGSPERVHVGSEVYLKFTLSDPTRKTSSNRSRRSETLFDVMRHIGESVLVISMDDE